MNLSDVQELLAAEVICQSNKSDLKILTACGADLMSDVLAFSKEKTLLLTGLTNPQVVRTAEMIDLELIVFVRGKKPPQKTIELAKEKKINLLTTDKPLYEACGILYAEGLGAEKLDEIE
ncbi:MAG: DRTGG domain-containing protein [Bacillota bacterium]